jgi:hypothetical protein
MSFTPGPWRVVETPTKSRFSAGWREIQGPGPRWQGVVWADWYQAGEDTYSGVKISEADAHLIAAAPDLLAALQELLEYAAVSEIPGEAYIQQARAAIAKAEGKAVPA